MPQVVEKWWTAELCLWLAGGSMGGNVLPPLCQQWKMAALSFHFGFSFVQWEEVASRHPSLYQCQLHLFTNLDLRAINGGLIEDLRWCQLHWINCSILCILAVKCEKAQCGHFCLQQCLLSNVSHLLLPPKLQAVVQPGGGESTEDWRRSRSCLRCTSAPLQLAEDQVRDHQEISRTSRLRLWFWM